MDQAEIETIEVELLVEAIRRRHGYDFGGYARASLKRRLVNLQRGSGLARLSDLIPAILHGEIAAAQLITGLSVPVTEMFRDPCVFQLLREQVFPVLASHPQINIWQAGCASGEETYSLAILLHEEGLLERSRIYATDIDAAALHRAEEGIYPADRLRSYSAAYLKAGGKASLSDYYHARYDAVKLHDFLRRPMLFAEHNLVSDGVFCEAQLILCRNVLIYFDRDLQRRVLRLLHDSLGRGGFLDLGTQESLAPSPQATAYRTVGERERVFQLTGRSNRGSQ